MRHALTPLLSLLLLAVGPIVAETLDGRVVSVADGDTITILDDAQVRHRIRLAAIDAPEKGEPFGERSKQNLSQLVYGKVVRVDWQKQDRDGCLIGTVWAESPDMPCRDLPSCPKTLDAGLAQITVGLAWHFKRHADEQEPQQRGQYEFAEIEARAKKVGLWSDPNPVPLPDGPAGMLDAATVAEVRARQRFRPAGRR
jgi:endonuclease YncB( thermonuclease family)